MIICKAYECSEELKFSGDALSIDELINKIKDREQTPALLLEYIKGCNKKIKQRVRIDITRSTYIKYQTCLNHMEDFLKNVYKTRKFYLHSMSGKFLEKYFYYLRTNKNIVHNAAIK